MRETSVCRFMILDSDRCSPSRVLLPNALGALARCAAAPEALWINSGAILVSSAALGLERTHLLVEFCSHFLECLDCSVVHSLFVAAAQAVLLGLELQALRVGVHVAVVFLQG